MKFTSLLALASIAAAQNVFITSPEPGTEVAAGDEIVVQLIQPGSQSSYSNIGIAIGLQPCPDPNEFCYPASSVLGWTLYAGSFNPIYNPVGSPWQNFTVTIPERTPAGLAIIGVAHAALVGVMGNPSIATTSVEVTIV
ncbi:hypothetical protein BJY04DRAFT_196705 [Aspergillus karnatakaensis]|uniref:uncharacterized protein n=1 Tax=Aspergillus karnatakaensis TaxID=1810916 RepID=UPI003CCD1E2B